MTDPEPNINSSEDNKLEPQLKTPRNSFFSKFSSLPNKKLLLVLLIIVISLPVTLVLVQQQQIFQKNAAEPANTLASNMITTQEDSQPADNVPFTDVKTARAIYEKQASTTDSLPVVAADTPKPNIIVIMLDDVNPMDGRFFTKERMPATYNNIVSKGINFTNFYGETSICCPGRVGFLTGQHSQNHKVVDLDGRRFNPAVSIATELQAKNYFTMLTGKYINEFKMIPQAKAIPPGWNKFDAIYENNGRYYDYDIISKKSGPTNTESTIKHYGNTPAYYSTDVIADIAVTRLKEAPANKPIFAFINPYSIHGPKSIAPRYANDPRCANIPNWQAPNVFEQDVSDKSEWIRNLKPGNVNNGYSLKTDCEVLLATDDLVKRIRNTLSNQGRLQNTIFILTADNGYGFGEHRIPAKTTPYTTLVPMYVAWPAGRGIATKTDTTVLSNIDLAETFCELAGCNMGPYPNGQTKTDGVSFLSLIKNQPASFTRYAILESQPVKPYNASPDTRPAWWAIRTTEQYPNGKWHYIEYATGEKELYDVSNGPCYKWTPSLGGDPCELNNLLSSAKGSPSTASLATANELKSMLAKLKKEKGFMPPLSPTPTRVLTPTPTNAPIPTSTSVPTPTVGIGI